jgi:hypothetical protein
MKGKAAEKRKRCRSQPPAEVLRNADTVRNLGATLKRRGLPSSLCSVATETFRRWLNARRKHEDTITVPVPELMKRLGISERSARRALAALRDLSVLVPVAVDGFAGEGRTFTRLVAPKGGFEADQYWFDALRFAVRIGASERLAAAMRDASTPPPWLTVRGATRGAREVPERGVSGSNFPDENQYISAFDKARGEIGL